MANLGLIPSSTKASQASPGVFLDHVADLERHRHAALAGHHLGRERVVVGVVDVAVRVVVHAGAEAGRVVVMVGELGLAQPGFGQQRQAARPTPCRAAGPFGAGPRRPVSGASSDLSRKSASKAWVCKPLGRVGADGRDDLHAPLGPLREALLEPGAAQRLADLGGQLDGAADGLVLLGAIDLAGGQGGLRDLPRPLEVRRSSCRGRASAR